MFCRVILDTLTIEYRQILAHITKTRLEAAKTIETDEDTPINYAAFATETEGYSVTDLRDLVSRAIFAAAIRTNEEGPNAAKAW